MPGRIAELLAVALALATLAATMRQAPDPNACARPMPDRPQLVVTPRDVEEVLGNE